MAELRVADRQLMVDEIIKQLEIKLASKKEQWNTIVERENIAEDLHSIEDIGQQIRNCNIKINKLQDSKKSEIEDLEKKFNFKYNGYYNSNGRNINDLKEHLLKLNGAAIPTRKEIETAIFLAQGGSDMSTLMNNIIKQFSK